MGLPIFFPSASDIANFKEGKNQIFCLSNSDIFSAGQTV